MKLRRSRRAQRSATLLVLALVLSACGTNLSHDQIVADYNGGGAGRSSTASGGTPQAARNLHMGDFVNLDMRLNLDFSDILDVNNLVPSPIAPGTVVNEVLGCISSLSLTSQKCIDVLASVKALAQLKSECLKTANAKTAVCKMLNLIPGLPNLTTILPKQLSQLLSPVLGGGTTSGGTTSGGSSGSGSGGGLLGGLGLRQQAPAAERAGVSYGSAGHGPTYGALSALYDPSLVALLVPPMTATTTGGAR